MGAGKIVGMIVRMQSATEAGIGPGMVSVIEGGI